MSDDQDARRLEAESYMAGVEDEASNMTGLYTEAELAAKFGDHVPAYRRGARDVRAGTAVLNPTIYRAEVRPVKSWRWYHVDTRADIRQFFDRLLAEGVSFHPDESAHGIVEHATGEFTYTDPEADNLDRTMDRCLDLGESGDFDVYEVAVDAFTAYQGEVEKVRAVEAAGREAAARFRRDDELQKGE